MYNSQNLYNLIQNCLHEFHDLSEKEADFIHRVSTTYVLNLMELGHIPGPLYNEVLEEIQEIALEFYRKKTYGHLNLESYRKSVFSRAQK